MTLHSPASWTIRHAFSRGRSIVQYCRVHVIPRVLCIAFLYIYIYVSADLCARSISTEFFWGTLDTIFHVITLGDDFVSPKSNHSSCSTACVKPTARAMTDDRSCTLALPEENGYNMGWAGGMCRYFGPIRGRETLPVRSLRRSGYGTRFSWIPWFPFVFLVRRIPGVSGIMTISEYT